MEEKKSFKEKVNRMQELAKEKLNIAVEWSKDHKEMIAVFGPVVIGGAIEILKIATKRHTVNEEKALKERFVYDRSNGHYYELKRQPKSSEWMQIEQRKQNGETLGWILNDMRLLSK